MRSHYLIPLALLLASCAPAPLITPLPALPVASTTPAPPAEALPLEAELAIGQTRVAALALASTATRAAQTATKQAWADGETATWAAIAKTNVAADRAATAQAAAAVATAERADTQAAQLRTATAEAAAVQATLTAMAQAEQDRQQRATTAAQLPWQVGAMLAGLGLGGLIYLLYTARLAHERETAQALAVRMRVIRQTNELILVSPTWQGGRMALLTERIAAPAAAATEPEALADELEDLTAEPETVAYTAAGQRTAWDRDADGQIGHSQAQLAARKKVLRFLSRAITVLGMSSQRVPTADEMRLHPETWGEAVGLLKPHVTTTVGRNGGTYCANSYPTLRDLWTAVGQWQIDLGGAEGIQTWPAAQATLEATTPPVTIGRAR